MESICFQHTFKMQMYAVNRHIYTIYMPYICNKHAYNIQTVCQDMHLYAFIIIILFLYDRNMPAISGCIQNMSRLCCRYACRNVVFRKMQMCWNAEICIIYVIYICTVYGNFMHQYAKDQ